MAKRGPQPQKIYYQACQEFLSALGYGFNEIVGSHRPSGRRRNECPDILGFHEVVSKAGHIDYDVCAIQAEHYFSKKGLDVVIDYGKFAHFPYLAVKEAPEFIQYGSGELYRIAKERGIGILSLVPRKEGGFYCQVVLKPKRWELAKSEIKRLIKDYSKAMAGLRTPKSGTV